MSSPDRLREVAKDLLEGLVLPIGWGNDQEVKAEEHKAVVRGVVRVLQSEREDAAREALSSFSPLTIDEHDEKFAQWCDDNALDRFSEEVAELVRMMRHEREEAAREAVEGGMTRDQCLERMADIGFEGVETSQYSTYYQSDFGVRLSSSLTELRSLEHGKFLDWHEVVGLIGCLVMAHYGNEKEIGKRDE